MPIEAEIEGIGILEFPDGTSEEVINRTVRKEVLRKQGSDAASASEMQDKWIGAIETAQKAVGRISLGGIGRIAGAAAKDIVAPTGIAGENLGRELLGEEPSPLSESSLNAPGAANAARRGLIGAAETAPLIGVAMAGQAVGVPAPVTMGLGMGAQAFESSGGDVGAAAKGAAIGAAIPIAARIGAIGGAAATGAAVNRGATALANPVVQKAIEVGASQVPVQAILLGDLMASEEYRNASPERRNELLVEYGVSNLPFAIPEVMSATKGPPLARMFESPAVDVARALNEGTIQGIPEAMARSRELQASLPSRPGEQIVNGQRTEQVAQPITASEPGMAAIIGEQPQNVQQVEGKSPAPYRQARFIGQQEGPAIDPLSPTDEAAARVAASGMPSTAVAVAEQGNVLDAMASKVKGGDVTNAEEVRPQGQEEVAQKQPSKLTPEQEALQAELDAELGQDPRTYQMALGPDPKKVVGAAIESGIALKQAIGFAARKIKAGTTDPDVAYASELINNNGLSTIENALDYLSDDRSHGDEYSASAARPVAVEMFGTADPDKLGTIGGPDRILGYVVAVNEYARKLQMADDGDTGSVEYNMAIGPDGKKVAKAAAEGAKSVKEAVGFALKKMAADDDSPTGVRRFAQRAARAQSIKKEVREAIKESPRRFYEKQNWDADVEAAQTMPDSALSADLNKGGQSNTAVISGMELANRAKLAGNDKAAEDLWLTMAEKLTSAAQLLGTAKLLKSTKPEYMVDLMNKTLEKAKYDPLTPAEAKEFAAIADASIKAEQARKDTANAFREVRTPEAFEAALKALEASERAGMALNDAIARKTPGSLRDKWRAIYQGSLLTSKSHLRNILGNLVNLGIFQTAVEPVAAAIDYARSPIVKAIQERRKAAGKAPLKNPFFDPKRVSTYRPIESIGAMWRAKAKAFGAAKDILLKGASTVNYEAGQYGGVKLNTIRAWKDMLAGQMQTLAKKAGKVPLKDRVGLVLEGTVGAIPDFMLRGLGAMDAIFRLPEYERLVYNAARMEGLSTADAKMAQKYPELFLSKKALDQLNLDAARGVLQQDNILTNAAAAAEKWLGNVPGVGFFLPSLYRSLAPYVKTPINWAVTASSFFPKIGMLYAATAYSIGKTRDGNRFLASAIVGHAMATAAAWLYDKGVVAPPLDDPNEPKKLRAGLNSTFPAGTFNWSAFKRAVETGERQEVQTGDDIVDIRTLGIPGAVMHTTALQLRSDEKKRDQEQPDMLGSLVDGMFSDAKSLAAFTFSQQFLQGPVDFIEALKRDGAEGFIANYMSALSAPLAPNVLTDIAKAQRSVRPEFKDDQTWKAIANRLQERLDALGFKQSSPIPGTKATKDLPPRVDLWGRPIEQVPEGKNPWAWTLLDVSNSRIVQNDADAALYNLYRRTLDTKVFPSFPDRTLEIKGKKTAPMSYEQYAQFMTFVGQERRSRMETLMLRPSFIEDADQDKVRKLAAVYEKGYDEGRKEFLRWLRDTGQELEPLAPMRGTLQNR